MSEEYRWDRRDVRGIKLLEGEEPLLALNSRDGLASGPPPEGDFLLLTNRRVMDVSRDGGRDRLSLASIEDIDSAEIATPAKDSGALLTGALLVLAGLVAGILMDAFGFPLLIALAAVGALVGLGVISASKYFIADGTATVVFRAGAFEMDFPLHGERVVRDAHSLVSTLFELKAGQGPSLSRGIVAQPSDARPPLWSEASADGEGGQAAGADTSPVREDTEAAPRDWRPQQPPVGDDAETEGSNPGL